MKIQLSQNFIKKTYEAVFAIIMFILVYILLLILAIILTVVCVFGGLFIIKAKTMAITIGLGIGLASVGFLILFFLFKFIFKKHKVDRSHLIEISENDEPKLYKFIEQIVDEVGTNFPKKIYLSADVNACVFYDSSFWSMFFPVKKNLQIGLGLINTITVQEFKAILAHEFGHFSQRSMKVGSYVYNVNQVIYNMLYDNESYDKMIASWANFSSYFLIFVKIAEEIIECIQWILRQMYEYVNVKYMALSREMEFHADEVAANVAGYIPLKESLLRMDLADYSFNSVLSFYDNKISDNIKSKNIYKEHFYVLNFLANENNLPYKNDLPLVSELDLSKYNKSKLIIKDQWASHPSTEERIKALEKLNINKEYYQHEPAIQLFRKAEAIEEKLTDKVFSSITYEKNATKLDFDLFKNEFKTDYNKGSFPKEYNKYYDNKNPTKFDIENLEDYRTNETMESLFSKEHVDLIYDNIALENDINILNSIANKEFIVKTFDYDGKKYKASDAENLIKTLKKEVTIYENNINSIDIEIYKYFYNKAKLKGNEHELKRLYIDFFTHELEYETKSELYKRFINSTQFISVVTPIKDIEINFEELLDLEKELKIEIKSLLQNKDLQEEITIPMKDNFEKYLSQNWVYFKNNTYNNDNLNILFTALNNYNYLLLRNYFINKLNLLNFQIKQLEK